MLVTLPIILITQFLSESLPIKNNGFSGHDHFFGTDQSVIANIGCRANPFAPSKDGENRHQQKLLWGLKDQQQKIKSEIFLLRSNALQVELIFLCIICSSLSHKNLNFDTWYEVTICPSDSP